MSDCYRHERTQTRHRAHRPSSPKATESPMVVATDNDAQHHELHGFAIELRQLAYTMPGGHEDPLIRLSERMVSHAQLVRAEN